MNEDERLGIVVGGSLSEGLIIRLDETVSVEDLAVGGYVVVEGQKLRFFGMVTDVELGAAHPDIASNPPDISDPFIAEVVAGTSTFGLVHLMPMLTIEQGIGALLDGPRPVKTVPAHFSLAARASQEDIESVFGREDENHFYIGNPLEMEGARIHLDLRRLVERSSGVFGKTGTGKTFFTRLLLLGIIQKNKAVNLIFDMHSDYGWEGIAEGGKSVKGLKQLLGSKVAIFSLDEESSRRRGFLPDSVVAIGYEQIEPEDIALLRETLEISEPQIESVYRLARRYGEDRWFGAFLDSSSDEREELAKEQGLNPTTLNVLHRKLETRLARLPFLKPRPVDDSVKRILDHLQKGISVVLEFGGHNTLEAYILVANILTRRIHERYVEAKERAMGNQAAEPRPLVITIEEAHKFLSPEVAGQTIFGTIAREMRKYNVTLLVVDQRPSGIDDEIMSQIGSRITCLLDDEKDIAAVLSGIHGASSLRNVLARLDPKQQALILGYAVPMPVVVRVRDYGPQSYGEFGFVEETDAVVAKDKALRDLGYD